jgi:prophage regulatory protein
MANTILRLPYVKSRTGLSRSTIYLRIAAGSFPKPISLGSRAVGWLESEIDGWLTSRVEASRNPASKAA